jgi:CBS domain-containing protein
MLVKDIMTKDLEVVSGQKSVMEAAQIMKELNVGALPVGDHSKIQGMVTDRDIAVQVVAEGKDPGRCKVDEIMSSPIEWISQDSEADEAARLMADKKIRRLIVMDNRQRPVGFLALGDLATKGPEEKAEEALARISEPSRPTH